MKKQGFNFSVILGLSMTGVACGGGSSLLSTGADGVYRSKIDEHSSDSASVEDDESLTPDTSADVNEEVPATVPVIISGSFLTCSLFQRDQAEHLACYPEQPFETKVISAGSTLEILSGVQNTLIKIGSIIQDEKGFVSRLNLIAPLGTWLSIINSSKNQSDGNKVIELRIRDLNATHSPQSPQKDPTPSPVDEPSASEIITPPDTPPKPTPVPDESNSKEPENDDNKSEDDDKEDPNPGLNLVVNGSFESENPQLVAAGIEGFYEKYSEINGWSRSSGSDLEVQKRLFNYSGKDGQSWLELCSTGNSGIKQDIVTEPGASYTLKFHHSARPGVPEAQNHLIVSIEGVVIQEYFMNGIGLTAPVWSEYFIYFASGDGQTTITFESGGCAGINSGTWIDDISVVKTK